MPIQAVIPAQDVERRTHVRYRVLAFGAALAALTYFDRVCISMTAGDMMADLSLTRVQMGLVFSAFTLAYGLFEIPTGIWGDRVGTRRILTRIVLWWSSFTIATSLAFNYLSLIIIRFLFGAGEAGCFPMVAKSFSRWFPSTERGTAQGVFFMGAHLGGGITPLLVTAMMGYFSWHWVFVIFGFLGFLWVLAWYPWFRDDPGEHPSVNASELRFIRQGIDAPAVMGSFRQQWRRLFLNRNVIALCLMYFTQNYAFYFFISWLPTYLESGRGFTGSQLAFYAGLPLTMSVFADVFGGVTTDSVSSRFGLRIGRAGIGGVAFLFAGLAMIAAAASLHAVASAVLIAVASAATMFTLGASWGTCLDIAGAHAGTVTAAMNTFGQIGGIISPIVFAFLIDEFEDWNLPLYVIGVLYLFGALCWWFVEPERRIFAESDTKNAVTI